MKHSSIFLSLILAATQSLANSPVVSEAQEETVHTAEPTKDELQLPEGEKRLRHGILLLGQLYQCMAEVNNKSAAEAAVPKIMQISEELRQWTQAFNTLPPLSEPEVLIYEERYLPIIQKINKLIQYAAVQPV